MKKENNRIQKHNKIAARKRFQIPMTAAEQNREDAIADNRTEGPGLRKGPMRERKRRSRDGGGGQEEYPPGVGWGGFPLLKKEEVSKVAVDNDEPDMEKADMESGE